ncbi:MAG: ribosome silencing factor [Oscillospiraceae bacterium]|nr:ribosome silencing factor [Oscillospiraceae bacterium]
MSDPKQTASMILKALDDKKALDVKLLQTDKITILADYFIICTATSVTHIKTLSEEADRVMSEKGQPPLRREGYRSGSWVLLDFGSVVVHLFLEETREFYDLERLWSDAEEIDLNEILSEK